jgi:hypothetical protein
VLIPFHFGGWLGILLFWRAWRGWVFGSAHTEAK